MAGVDAAVVRLNSAEGDLVFTRTRGSAGSAGSAGREDGHERTEGRSSAAGGVAVKVEPGLSGDASFSSDGITEGITEGSDGKGGPAASGAVASRALLVHIRPGWKEFRSFLLGGIDQQQQQSGGSSSPQHSSLFHVTVVSSMPREEALEVWRLLDLAAAPAPPPGSSGSVGGGGETVHPRDRPRLIPEHELGTRLITPDSLVASSSFQGQVVRATVGSEQLSSFRPSSSAVHFANKSIASLFAVANELRSVEHSFFIE